MKNLEQLLSPVKSIDVGYRKSLLDPISDGRFTAKMVENFAELESVLSLRSEVFKKELSNDKNGSDFDEYDLVCSHIIITDIPSGKAVGTYRLNTIETAKNIENFYSYGEFSLETLPCEIIENSVELGRACIAKDFRNSRVLFLLWKFLANFLKAENKRYFFGCCSVFTQDGKTAAKILAHLRSNNFVNEEIKILPRIDKKILPENYKPKNFEEIELPALVNIYLRVGARICGEPAIDREFGTVDYFIIFDKERINAKYLKMFFG